METRSDTQQARHHGMGFGRGFGWTIPLVLLLPFALGAGCTHSQTSARARAIAPSFAPTPVPVPMHTNREWDVLTASGTGDARARHLMLQAAEQFDDFEVHFTGIVIDAKYLATTARSMPTEPFTRVVREKTRRAVDVEDFLLFLDDVLLHRKTDLREKKSLFLSPGRARKGGILIHPDDVFTESPRRYGVAPLSIHHPIATADVKAAVDGDPLGPGWPARYRNPSAKKTMLAAIRRTNADYAFRVERLLEQVAQQKAEAYLTSTVRNRHRGYLMWGAYVLSNAKSEREVEALASTLDARNRDWGLEVDIRWRHPDGWRATIDAAHAMAEKYDVVFATEHGARNSNHYDARAVDLTIMGLPRSFTLTSPYDEELSKTFDLSGADNTRDMSLEPEIIAWMEKHFKMKKLLGDYPHWNDVAD